VPDTGPGSEETLVRLIYRSKATQAGAADQPSTLDAILRRARAHNQRHRVSGVLVFDGIHYLQMIEGASGRVENLYEAIARDMRHESLDVIDFLPIEAREHPGAPMAFLDVTGGGFPELQRVMTRGVQGFAPSLSSLIAAALQKAVLF
jgi:hypothetical protein